MPTFLPPVTINKHIPQFCHTMSHSLVEGVVTKAGSTAMLQRQSLDIYGDTTCLHVSREREEELEEPDLLRGATLLQQARLQ